MEILNFQNYFSGKMSAVDILSIGLEVAYAGPDFSKINLEQKHTQKIILNMMW